MRGNNRANVYNDEQDKYHLMRCIGEAHQRFQFTIVAFCIMSNHFHILIQSKDELSKIMARINRRYSDYYSKRYRHVGRIYQRRYFAKAIEDPHVLLIVSRYIHRNPLETKIPMVTDLHHYPHSSYPNYEHSSTNLYPHLDTFPSWLDTLQSWLEGCWALLETSLFVGHFPGLVGHFTKFVGQL